MTQDRLCLKSFLLAAHHFRKAVFARRHSAGSFLRGWTRGNRRRVSRSIRFQVLNQTIVGNQRDAAKSAVPHVFRFLRIGDNLTQERQEGAVRRPEAQAERPRCPLALVVSPRFLHE